MFLCLTGSDVALFPPLGDSVRPPYKVEVSVGDINILIVNACPCFALGVGVWSSFPLWSRVLWACESSTNNPVPIFPINSAMDVFFSGVES